MTNKVPVMAGTNTNEGNAFVWPAYEFGMTDSAFDQFTSALFTAHDPFQALDAAQLDKVHQEYPVTGDPREVAAEMITDATYLCDTQFSLQEHAAFANDVFLYRFDHRAECETKLLGNLMPGVFHASELPFVFGTPGTVACKWNAAEHGLSMRMQTMWTNFAKTLNPSPDSPNTLLPLKFPKYTNATREGYVFNAGTVSPDSIEKDYRSEKCKLWYNLIWSRYVQ